MIFPLTRDITSDSVRDLVRPGSFDPLSLDPYLLFDTRSSMIGTFETPTLDLDPSDPDTLDVITATRSGVATYTNANGVIQQAAPDTVRVDYVDGVPMILVEPSATNELTYNSTFESDWTIRNSAVEQSTVEAPDGSYAYRAYRSSAGNATFTQLVNVPCSNHTYTYSGYFKSDGTHNKASLYIYNEGGSGAARTNGISLEDGSVDYIYPPDGDFTASDFQTEEIGNGWWRIIATFTIQSATATGLNIRFYPASGSSDPVGWGQYVWGLQLEAGSVATSYIPTSGSTVTRQADDLVIDGSDFTDFFNNSEGTIYCEFEYDFEPAYEYIYNIRQDATNEIRTQLIPTNNIRTRYTVAGSHVAQPSPSGVVQGSLNRYAFSYKTNNFRGNVNGGNDEADLLGNTDLTPVRMKLGGRDSVLETTKFKRLIYWPYHSDSL